MLLTNTVRRSFVALVLALIALGGTACGGPDVNELIDQTFAEDKKVDSGRLSVAVNVRTQGGPPQLSQPVDLRLSGPFQGQGERQLPKFDFALTANLGGRSVNAGATSTADAGFVKLQGQAYRVEDSIFASFKQAYQQAQTQAARERQRGGDSPTTLGIDPRAWLRNAKVVGDEDVAGAETTHVAAQVDVPRLLDDVSEALGKARSQGLPQAGQLPPSLTPEQRRQVQEAVRGASFDFWTGKDDKVLRRLRVRLNFQVPPAERARTGGVTGGQVTFTLELADLNEGQSVSAPANPRPFSELGGALGGLGGGAARPSTAPGARPGGSPYTPAFPRCLREAAGDPAKIQRCNALLR